MKKHRKSVAISTNERTGELVVVGIEDEVIKAVKALVREGVGVAENDTCSMTLRLPTAEHRAEHRRSGNLEHRTAVPRRHNQAESVRHLTFPRRPLVQSIIVSTPCVATLLAEERSLRTNHLPRYRPHLHPQSQIGNVPCRRHRSISSKPRPFGPR